MVANKKLPEPMFWILQLLLELLELAGRVGKKRDKSLIKTV